MGTPAFSMDQLSYRFGAIGLAIVAESQRVADAVGSLFRHLGVSPVSGDASGGASVDAWVTVNLGVGEGGLDVPEEAQEIEVTNSYVRAWRAGELFFLTADVEGGRSVLSIDGATGKAVGRFHPALLDSSLQTRWHTLSLVVTGLFVLFEPHGLYPLHAAALGRGGGGLLLVADSDSGKSTLSYSLVREGWSYLSDDTILLSEAGDAIDAVPFRRHFGLDTVAAEFFPELAGGSHLPLAGQDKWVVDVGGQFPDRIDERLRPSVVVLPEIVDADESRLQPISAAEAHHALIRQSTLPYWDLDAVRKHLDALARLTSQTSHYRLLGGRDILRRPARASELLAPLLS